MRKRIWYGMIFPVLLVAVSVVVFVFPGGAQMESEYPVTRVSVILPHEDDGYWNLVTEGIEEAAEELGNQYGIDIRMIIPQLNYNIPQMTDLLRQQIAAQVDILVIQGNEDGEYRKALWEAYSQGIQIICVDTAMAAFPYHLYVGTDNYEAGKLQGEKLTELTGGKAKVAVISGEEGYLNLQERLQGFLDALRMYPEIEIQEVAYDHYDGLTFMRLYHELSTDADVLVCQEGTGGNTLGKVFEERDNEYAYIIGFDAYEAAGRGVLDGIVKQDTNQMGHRVVEEIVNYVKDGSYSAEDIYTDIHWLTEENYDEVME